MKPLTYSDAITKVAQAVSNASSHNNINALDCAPVISLLFGPTEETIVLHIMKRAKEIDIKQ